MSGGQNATGTAQPSTGTPNAAGAEPAAGATNAPRDISMPPVASTPTQAAPVETPANQQRITLPGDLNSALTNQQQQVDGAAQGAEGNSSLPTAPATVSGKAGAAASLPATGRQNAAQAPVTPRHTREPARTASKPAASEHKTHTTPAHSSVNNAPAKAAGSSATASKSVPGGNYTLQLSGASKAESLNAWAKKQNLSAYHVYKTTRNGQPRGMCWSVVLTPRRPTQSVPLRHCLQRYVHRILGETGQSGQERSQSISDVGPAHAGPVLSADLLSVQPQPHNKM